jgi:hypothetical protein
LGSSSVQEINAFKKIRMFSKTYTSNLNFIPNNFSSKYKLLSNLYLNDLNFSDSYLYGLKRQHNFLSSSSLINNQSTFLDLKSVNKVANFNYKNNIFENNNTSLDQINYLKKNNNSNFSSDINRLQSIFKILNKSDTYRLDKLFFYSNIISSINDKTKNKILYPIYKLFNSKLDKNINFSNFNEFSSLNNFNDVSLIDSNGELKNYFFNKNFNYKIPSSFSSNNSLLPSERYNRKFIKNSPSLTSYNHSTYFNTLNEYFINSNLNFGLDNLTLLNLQNNN